MSNAYNMALYENGGSNDFGYVEVESIPEEVDETGFVVTTGAQENSEKFFNAMRPHLNILKDCGRDNGEECFSEEVQNWNGDAPTKIVKMQSRKRRFAMLRDGMSVGFMEGIIYVDVNGLKGPNTGGVDVFQFNTSEKSLGFGDDMSSDVRCYTNPFSCSAWVIKNENMDYLKCNDLSWNGKTKCK